MWPRSGVITDDGQAIATDAVPEAVIISEALLMQAASLGALDGGCGGPHNPDREIRREASDDASVEFAPGSSARKFAMVSGLVRHLTTAHALGPFRQVACARG